MISTPILSTVLPAVYKRLRTLLGENHPDLQNALHLSETGTSVTSPVDCYAVGTHETTLWAICAPDCGERALQDFRALLVKLMVDANDDPQTQAYKQIEQLVEAQVLYTCGTARTGFLPLLGCHG